MRFSVPSVMIAGPAWILCRAAGRLHSGMQDRAERGSEHQEFTISGHGLLLLSSR